MLHTMRKSFHLEKIHLHPDGFEILPDTVNHRHEKVMLPALAERLGMDNRLVFPVNRRPPVVGIDKAVRGLQEASKNGPFARWLCCLRIPVKAASILLRIRPPILLRKRPAKMRRRGVKNFTLPQERIGGQAGIFFFSWIPPSVRVCRHCG